MKDKNFIIGIVIAIELIIVIVLLAIIASPMITLSKYLKEEENYLYDDSLNQSEIISPKGEFIKDAQKLFQIAQNTYISSALNGEALTCFDGSVNHKLDLTTDVKYYLKFDANGYITNFQVSDNSFNISKSGTDIEIADLNDANYGKLENIKTCNN